MTGLWDLIIPADENSYFKPRVWFLAGSHALKGSALVRHWVPFPDGLTISSLSG